MAGAEHASHLAVTATLAEERKRSTFPTQTTETMKHLAIGHQRQWRVIEGVCREQYISISMIGNTLVLP